MLRQKQSRRGARFVLGGSHFNVSLKMKEMERVDAAMQRLNAAKDDPTHPQHKEATRLSHKLATDFSVPAKTLLEMSTFWS